MSNTIISMKIFFTCLGALFLFETISCSAGVTEKMINGMPHKITRDDRGVLVELINSPQDILDKLNIDGDKRRLQRDSDLSNGTRLAREFLSLHNQYRSTVARGDTPGEPSAQMMNQLFWDPALEALAQQYADKCLYAHNPNRESELFAYENSALFRFDTRSVSIGENLYATSADETLENILRGVTLWYEEYQYYTFNTRYCDPQEQCGHYTQMVWDTTRYVGCAYTMCDPLSGVPWSSESIYLVCNYFPAGNRNDEQPYDEGTPCTNCENDRTECEDSLCSGCMSEWYSYCGDFFTNCASLTSLCKANCTLNDLDDTYCGGCRRSCDTCTERMLSARDSCINDVVPDEPDETDGTPDGTRGGTMTVTDANGTVIVPNSSGNSIKSNIIMCIVIIACLGAIILQ